MHNEISPSCDRFIVKREVTHLTSLRPSKILSLERAGKFPKRIPLSRQRCVWSLNAIEQWMREQIAQRSN